MARELTKSQLIERSIIKKYRKSIWNSFIECVKEYSLISKDDIIGIALENSAESVLCTKLMQQLQKVSEVEFLLKITADKNLVPVAEELNIPLCDNLDNCTKTVDFICFDNVVEQVIRSMLFEHQIKSITPSHIKNDLEIISPLYCIEREQIYAFSRYNNLGFEYKTDDDEISKKVQVLVNRLKSKNEGIEKSIFKSVHAVCLDTLLGYESDSEYRFFIDEY